jgi:3-oxoacyl-[acyl-carrier protein] reductase
MNNKVVLITGGSRGLGAEACIAFAQAGATVILNYASNERAAAEVAGKIKSAGGKVLVVCADVSSEAEVKSMINRAFEQTGGLDILVNNAAVNSDHRVEHMTVEEWDRIMAVNLRGPFLCAKHAIPLMRKRGYGRIINLSSQGVRRGSVAHAHYAAAKLGLIGLTRCLAKELGPEGITVNAVAPGRIMTDMLASNLSHNDQEGARRKQWLKETPLGRFGEAREVADTILFLASEKASYITGQVIPVDGGLLMR